MAEPNEIARADVAKFEALAEAAYEEMYETRSPTGPYSDLKEFFALAIEAAERGGLHEDAKRLSARLEHCKQVYRSQFTT